MTIENKHATLPEMAAQYQSDIGFQESFGQSRSPLLQDEGEPVSWDDISLSMRQFYQSPLRSPD